MRPRPRFSLMLLCLCGVALVVGCRGDGSLDDRRNAKPASPTNDDPGTVDAEGGAPRVSVIVSDTSIDLPGALPPGPVVFVVRNRGSKPHRFAIGGAGIEARLDRDLAPGEDATLAVSLTPGRYRVWCPSGDHGGTPARRVVVTERARLR
jgi:hypothetical protein